MAKSIDVDTFESENAKAITLDCNVGRLFGRDETNYLTQILRIRPPLIAALARSLSRQRTVRISTRHCQPVNPKSSVSLPAG